MDAVDNMVAGQRLMRQSWVGQYVIIQKGQKYIWNIGQAVPPPAVNVAIYTPSIDDLKSEDWMVKTN